MTCPNFDAWNQVQNGPDTYKAIAAQLIEHQCCVIGWSDNRYTHHDVLFVLSPRKFGRLYNGIKADKDLFVSLMKRGSFGFALTSPTENLHPGYIAHKLGENNDETMQALGELINGIMREIWSAQSEMNRASE